MSFFEVIDQDKLLVLKNLNLENEDFSGKNLIGFYVMNSFFHSCKFENLIVKSMCFGGGEQQTIYTNCSFNRSELCGPTGGNARFENCTFNDIDLTDFFFHKNEFINCTFSGNLKKIMFQGRLYNDDIDSIQRTDNQIFGNDFSDTKFNHVRFEGGIDLSRQKLPVTDKYILIKNGVKVFEEFKKELIATSDENLKKCACGLFKTLEKSIVEDGQHQYFLELNDQSNQKEVYDLLKRVVEKEDNV